MIIYCYFSCFSQLIYIDSKRSVNPYGIIIVKLMINFIVFVRVKPRTLI